MPIKSFIEWLGFEREIQVPKGVRAKFLLKYGDLVVGTLSTANEVWSFEYSDEFKQQNLLRPLVEFPDVNKPYESSDLWQFFASRIPSPEQAEVEEILRRENIEEDDAVRLLERFGKRTIANPFELEAAA